MLNLWKLLAFNFFSSGLFYSQKLTLDQSSKIFIGSTQISNDLPITKIGDSVEISYDNDTEALIGLSTFKNKSIGK